ncbi:MAG: hypothetical protein OXB94_00890 [Nitrospira sp.]|nr:hypothetical protein [Nitrospira sp.]
MTDVFQHIAGMTVKGSGTLFYPEATVLQDYVRRFWRPVTKTIKKLTGKFVMASLPIC